MYCICCGNCGAWGRIKEERSLCLAFYIDCIIIVGCRKIKEKYHGYSDTNNILYVVYDSKLCIAGSLVADLCLCRRLGLPNTQQMVLHFPRNLQRGDILVPRTIQGIDHCVHSYSLHSFVDRRIKRSIQQTQIRTWSLSIDYRLLIIGGISSF